jgi:exopolyphosphatase / guanosine-5'-triphosphate,3'-diphosphate pyrophosphatase
MLKAIVDLGTNTFQFFIVKISENQTFSVIHEESRAAKIGKGGISDGRITPEAIQRATNILADYVEIAQNHAINPSEITAIGTSAIRNAINKDEFCEIIKQQTGIQIAIIDGETEAQLIYEGVRLGTPIGRQTALIMDIGGGSVEFIIANQKRIFWKQSFEIGGQRLMDKFMHHDPIDTAMVGRLYQYLEEQLLPLTNAVHQYAPEVLLGSAGSFETLNDMYHHKQTGTWPDASKVSFELPKADFEYFCKQLLSLDRPSRMALPGMIELRVDMIVVGVCLIDFVLKRFQIQDIKVTLYALKEGVLSRML